MSTEFKLPDPKKRAGNVLGVGLLAAAGLAGYYYLLPFLLTIVWGTAELIIGIVVTSILAYVVFSKKFWTRTKIILDTLGEILFKGFVEMNPFTILEMQVDRAEKDREDLKVQIDKLKGQEAKLIAQLKTEDENMKQAAKEMEICKKKLLSDPNNDEVAMLLETSTVNFSSSKGFIDDVKPIYNDILRLVTFADKAYRKSEFALKNARTTIQKQRAAYDAVTAGSSAMKKALRAFTGDPEMNKAGNIALERLRTDIANKIGTIKNSIQITSQIMNERDLRDAAKVARAADEVEKLNIDDKFEYSNTLTDSVIPMTQSGNKYVQLLNK